MIKQDHYANGVRTGHYKQPRRTDSAKDTDASYFLAACQYWYGKYCNNEFQVKFGGVIDGRSIGEQRLYGEGRQPTDKYKKLLDPETDKDGTAMNISWDIFNIYPKFRSLLIAKLMERVYKPGVQANSELALNKKSLIKYYTEFDNHPEVMPLRAEVGLPGYAAEAGVEVDEDNYDNIRLDVEIGLLDSIQEVFRESASEVVIQMFLEDLVDTKFCMSVADIDPISRKQRFNYIDIARGFFRQSKFPDHRDIDVAGYIDRMTLSEIQASSNFTDEEMCQIAEIYKGESINNGITYSSDWNINRETTNSSTQSRGYDSLSGDVMTLYFISNTVQQFVSGYHKMGNKIFEKVADDFQPSDRISSSGKEYIKTNHQFVYTCKWVVGTDKVFNYGTHFTARQGQYGSKRACLPIKVCSFPGVSFTERCISIIDDIQMDVLKMRNMEANMPPMPLMDVDLSALDETVEIGNDSYNFLDLAKVFVKTGKLFYRSKGEWDTQTASNKRPITFTSSPVLDELIKLKGFIMSRIEDIRQVTSLNEYIDGTSQPDMQVGIAKGMESATNNALRHPNNIFKSYLTQIAKQVGYTYQMAVVKGDIEGYYFSDKVQRIFRLTKDLLSYEFDIFVTMEYSNEEKQTMIGKLAEMSGKGMIDEAVFMKVYRMIMDGDFTKAQVYLSKAISDYSQLMHNRQLEVQQAQGEANAMAAKVTEEEKRKTIMLQLQVAKEMKAMDINAVAENTREQGNIDLTIESLKSISNGQRQQQ
jgi:hypothetical protein